MGTEDLIVAVKSGDLDKYDELVREHQAAVRAFVATYCPNWEIVDELAQQTFIWAYEHLDEYKAGTKFQSWLKAIARNKLLAQLKDRSRHSGRHRKYAEFVQTTAALNSLESQSTDREPSLSSALSRCVEKLPADSREIIMRRYHEGVSLKDLAVELSKSEASLKGTLFRIRQMLKRCVEEQGHLPLRTCSPGEEYGS